MDKNISGSWLIHHTNKLQNISNQTGYEKTFLAGKSGILLSAISSDNNIVITNQRLETLARANNINIMLELPTLIDVLSKRQLIDKTDNGVAILGVTTSSTLQHTSDIFDYLEPTKQERAAIELAEKASSEPIREKEATEELADKYLLTNDEIGQLLFDAEQVGFVDAEELGNQDKLYFNGNLFRRDTAQKIMKVLESLSTNEQLKLQEVTERLKKEACITVENVKRILGEQLYSKIISIGLFDTNIVSNSTENVGFITLPSAFSKFSSPMVDDAFDLAKAFISSIKYGMIKSSHERGNIRMVEALLKTLVRGESVGPVPAIAEDYKILELKGVVQVKMGSKKGRTGAMLTLLKKEIGELALLAIRDGDVSEHSLPALPSAAVTKFNGPEQNRIRVRRNQIINNPRITNDMISALRTGGGF